MIAVREILNEWCDNDFEINAENKKLINKFVKQLKKDKIAIVYDMFEIGWVVKNYNYGAMFIDYCLNKLNGIEKEINYDCNVDERESDYKNFNTYEKLFYFISNEIKKDIRLMFSVLYR